MKAILVLAFLCVLAASAQAAVPQPVEKQDLVKCANDVINTLKGINNLITILNSETVDTSALIAAALALLNTVKKIPGDCFGSA